MEEPLYTLPLNLHAAILSLYIITNQSYARSQVDKRRPPGLGMCLFGFVWAYERVLPRC